MFVPYDDPAHVPLVDQGLDLFHQISSKNLHFLDKVVYCHNALVLSLRVEHYFRSRNRSVYLRADFSMLNRSSVPRITVRTRLGGYSAGTTHRTPLCQSMSGSAESLRNAM